MPRPEPAPVGPLRPLTVAEYADLDETEHGYTELIEGRLLRSPNSAFHHNRAVGRLHARLAHQLPANLEVIPKLAIDLELRSPGEPGFSRRPDLAVVKGEAGARIADEGGLVRASEVVLVVEIVAHGSRRIDRVDKRRDYADADVPHYCWMFDIDHRSLTACRLTEKVDYQDVQVTGGVFRTETPFPFEVDLERLA